MDRQASLYRFRKRRFVILVSRSAGVVDESSDYFHSTRTTTKQVADNKKRIDFFFVFITLSKTFKHKFTKFSANGN